MKKINCILLIDDNPADNVYNKIIITEADVCHHIEVAASGADALAYLNKCIEENNPQVYPKPDLIFLDINMPPVSGFDFLKEYNKINWKFPDTQVIMLTTSLNPDDKTDSVRAFDISNFINKPLTVEIVKKTIEKYF